MDGLRLKKESFLYVHPMTKIATFFSCSILMMSSGERLVENLTLALLLLMLLNGKFYSLFTKMLVFCLLLLIGEACVISFGLPVILLSVIKILKMFIPSIISYYLLAKGSTSLEIMTALNDFKFPKGITIPLVVMIRFIPTVVDSIKETGKALKIKGVTKKSIFRHPITSSELILIPVLMSCVNSMDDLASASMARGFSLTRERTHVLELKFSFVDVFIVTFFVLMAFSKWWM